MTMRLFAALNIDDHTRGELSDELAYLKHHFPKIRWVRPENLHVTVKFFGNVEENDVTPLCEALVRAAGEIPAFTLDIESMGAFPNLRRPRTVWAGCGLGSTEAEKLHQAVERETVPLGYAAESRRYRPHVTIGRIKQPAAARGLDTCLTDPEHIHFGSVDVDSLTLFLSELKKGGAEYTPIFHTELA